MPRKLISDCYRGWYGRESRCNSVLRMSNCSMWDCKHKMDLEKFRHQLAMERLQASQESELHQSRKIYKSLQDEYSRIRAEQTVMQAHAFRKYDPTRSAQTPPPNTSRRQKTVQMNRRPKTECLSHLTSPSTGPLIKRNSLPNIEPLKCVPKRTTETMSKGKSTVLKEQSDVGANKSAAAAAMRLVEKNKPRKKKRSGVTSGDTFFVTRSDIITSTLLEESEEDGSDDETEDEVFYTVDEDPPILLSRNKYSGKETTEEPDVATLSENQPRVSLERQGKIPEADSFQSIDYILGAKQKPSEGTGTLTSTHLAKPSTPKATVKPSSPAITGSQSSQKPSLDSLQTQTNSSATFSKLSESVLTSTAKENDSSRKGMFAHDVGNNNHSVAVDANHDLVRNGHVQATTDDGTSCPKRPKSLSKSKHPLTVDTASKHLTALTTSQPQPDFSASKSSPRSPRTADVSAEGATSKPSLLSKFRQAAEVIVEEKRIERETNMSMFAALLLNRPKREMRLRPVEKPASVTEQEKRNLWEELLMNVQNAVRWKAKMLRESQGIPNTRQLRRMAQEQQQLRDQNRRHVFPGQCKTTYAMKKFLSKEVEQLVEAWRPENLRKRRNRKLVERATLPDFVDRVRSTTTILREFKRYQHDREDVGA